MRKKCCWSFGSASWPEISKSRWVICPKEKASKEAHQALIIALDLSLGKKKKRGPSMDGDYDSDDVAYKQCHQLEQRYTSERSILGAIGIVQVASSLFLLTAILPGIFGPSLLENAAGTPDDDVHLISNVILSNNPIVSWHLLSFFGESVNRLITKTTQQDSAIFDTAAAFWSVVQTFCNTIHIIIYLP